MNLIKNKLRKILFSIMSDRTIDLFYRFYYRIRYPKSMSKKCSYGEDNSDITFLVIRPRTDCVEGLMSLFMYVAARLYYAKEKGFIPIIDFENYKTQYSDETMKCKNSWEFYFTQPTEFTLEDVYRSKNVVLSGWDIRFHLPKIFKQDFSQSALEALHEIIFSSVDFNETVYEKVNAELEYLGLNCEKTLALYMRGTDYAALKPAGHPIQPTVDQSVEVVEEYLKKYDIEKIFLVTEDGMIYDKIKSIYGEKCVTVSFDTFVHGYVGKHYLSQDKSVEEISESPYIRGMNYLIKLIIMSKCSYFIGGNTMGSWAACIFSAKRDITKYIFDLGTYGK